MCKITTKYGILNGATIASSYSTGEPEAYRIEEESELEILETKFVPLYDFQNGRRKEFPAIKVYKNGNIKSLALNTSTPINMSIGIYDVEKITFYEDGQINRIFFLDGKLSGYWTEEDEYNLSQAYNFDFKFSKFEGKIISMHFYKTQEIKSITLWPKERIELNIGGYSFLGRIGISLYKSGELESCEPFRPIKVNTPIGEIEAYDINALGIHGDSNSLKFNEDGTLKALITSANTITITNKDGERILHAPKKIRLYSNSEVMDTITIKLEFIKNKVIIDEQFEYGLEENKFEIGYLGEKKFTLNGDITK